MPTFSTSFDKTDYRVVHQVLYSGTGIHSAQIITIIFVSIVCSQLYTEI